MHTRPLHRPLCGFCMQPRRSWRECGEAGLIVRLTIAFAGELFIWYIDSRKKIEFKHKGLVLVGLHPTNSRPCWAYMHTKCSIERLDLCKVSYSHSVIPIFLPSNANATQTLTVLDCRSCGRSVHDCIRLPLLFTIPPIANFHDDSDRR